MRCSRRGAHAIWRHPPSQWMPAKQWRRSPERLQPATAAWTGRKPEKRTFSKCRKTAYRSVFRIGARSFYHGQNSLMQGAFSLAKSPLLPLRGNSPEKCASQEKAFRAHLALRARLRRVALETLRCGSQCGARRGLCPSTPPPLKRWTKLLVMREKKFSQLAGVGPTGRGH